MITWLVIANSTNAFIYDISKPTLPEHQASGSHKHHYHLLTELSHPGSRTKISDLVSDRPGHYQASASHRGAYGAHTDAHENELHQFAKEIAHHLDAERNKNSYQRLIICAAAHFHHLINEGLSKQAASLVIKHIEKDYVPLNEKQLHDVIESIYREVL